MEANIMEASLHVIQIMNVLTALEQQDSRIKKKNIILANMSDRLMISIILYQLGYPVLNFDPALIRKPVFYIAEPPQFTEWEDLMDYFRIHRDSDDKIAAAQAFIRAKPKQERELWRGILAREYQLSNREYLTTVIRKGKNSA